MEWRAIHFLDETKVLPLCGYVALSWNWTRERASVTCKECLASLSSIRQDAGDPRQIRAA